MNCMCLIRLKKAPHTTKVTHATIKHLELSIVSLETVSEKHSEIQALAPQPSDDTLNRAPVYFVHIKDPVTLCRRTAEVLTFVSKPWPA